MKITILVLSAMASAALSGISSVNWSDRTQVALFALGIGCAALTTLKSVYVESPNNKEPK